MSLPEPLWPNPNWARTARLVLALTVASLAGGCFQPMYGNRGAVTGASSSLVTSMRGVTVAPVKTYSLNDRLPRVGVEVRNALIFGLTGGADTTAATHRVDISLSAVQQNLIVDVRTGRTEIQNYGVQASYQLIDLATGRTVVNGFTFARVSFNAPGLQQRFTGERGLRDAEDRAATVISDNVRNRLASYFTAGT